jgi:hypothetical protein
MFRFIAIIAICFFVYNQLMTSSQRSATDKIIEKTRSYAAEVLDAGSQVIRP